MAFGNPYGEPWSIDEVVNACELLVDLGVQQITLADTVGLATPGRIADTLARVIQIFDDIEIGVHLHALPGDVATRISAAYAAGCRRFDSAIGGLGGCPFAQDALVGNIPTETLLEVLRECGAEVPDLGPLQELVRASAAIAGHFGSAVAQPGMD
jgi:hydroxymethylglutaryl-CoA lyase